MDPATSTAAMALLGSGRGRRMATWVVVVGVAAVFAQAAAVALVIVMAVSSAAPVGACPTAVTESLSIMGPALSTADRVIAWWGERADPPRLRIAPAELVDLYYAEAQAEGVRPELALTQAVLETGMFGSSDTAINNFAGIGHPEGAGKGFSFESPEVGVRAHVQLLRAFAEGNDTDFASQRVAPRAAASATSVLELAGTWATDRAYARKMIAVLTAMTGVAEEELIGGNTGDDAFGGAAFETASCIGFGITGAAVGADGYSLPVDRVWYERSPTWFARPHHDYPASDVPVPEGTPVYAMVSGVVTAAPVGGRCGLGVSYRGDDGLSYVACHGRDGGLVVRPGDRVSAGQVIMHSSWTGNVHPPGPNGTHLHQGIHRNGQQLCPQLMFQAIFEGRGVNVMALPSSGCSY